MCFAPDGATSYKLTLRDGFRKVSEKSPIYGKRVVDFPRSALVKLDPLPGRGLASTHHGTKIS